MKQMKEVHRSEIRLGICGGLFVCLFVFNKVLDSFTEGLKYVDHLKGVFSLLSELDCKNLHVSPENIRVSLQES